MAGWLEFVLRRRMMVAIGAALVLILGVISWKRLPVDAFPDVTNQQVMILTEAVKINLVLAFFNLLPIPPLDGAWILEGFVSEEVAEKMALIRPYGFLILLVLFYSKIFGAILTPFLVFFYHNLFMVKLLGIE